MQNTVIISSYADTRIGERLEPILGLTARTWVLAEVRSGRLALRSPAWHGRKRVKHSARRLIRTSVAGHGVMIIVERVARQVMKVITVIVEGVRSQPRWASDAMRRGAAPIGRPMLLPLPPATAHMVPAA